MRRLSRRVCAYPGCQQRLHSKQKRYCSVAHIPHEKRVANGKASRAGVATRLREKLFGDVFRQLSARCVTREELLAVYRVVYERGYHAGKTAAYKARGLARAREAA